MIEYGAESFGPNGDAVVTFIQALPRLSEWVAITDIAAPLVAEPPPPGEEMNEFAHTFERAGQLAISVDRTQALVLATQATAAAVQGSKAAERAGLGVIAHFMASKRQEAADAHAHIALSAVYGLLVTDLLTMREFAVLYLPFTTTLPPVGVMVEGQYAAVSEVPGPARTKPPARRGGLTLPPE